jgi:hypothetical protein
MVTRLLGKHRGDGMKTATGVLGDQGLADSPFAAPVLTLVSGNSSNLGLGMVTR